MNNTKKEKKYRPYLLQYLEFHTGNVYDDAFAFVGNTDLEEILLKATPESITSWMRKKGFPYLAEGAEIGPDDVSEMRCTTFDMCKKALSWYMPDRNAPWSTRDKTGNATRSRDVNEFLKFIRTNEVRQMGQESSAKRALTEAEFRAALTILFSRTTFQLRYRMPAMMKVQYNMIMRSDDLGHLKTKDLHCHSDPRFRSFALELRVFWSKNVRDERRCPEQILLGSMDTSYCVLLALSIYLESWFTSNNGLISLFLFSDNTDPEKSPDRTKTNYAAALRTHLFNNPLFRSRTGADGGDLGSHSLRKYPATWASRLGCSRDDIDVRGRWKQSSQRVVDRYIDVKQQYTDAKVQSALCVGGPIKYKLVVGSGITEAWCKENVVPGICRYYVNPVERILLNVYRINETVQIDEVMDSEENGDNNNNNNRQQHNNEQNNNAINALFIQTMQLQQQLLTQYNDTTSNINNLRSEVMNRLNTVNNNLQRIYIQPPRMATPQQRQNNNEEATRAAEEEELIRRMPVAVLSSLPRTLHELWQEYQFGIGGRKAAKFFTTSERGGKNKFKYCRRKVFWDLISEHIKAGINYDVAIDRIYECYGRRLSVTILLELIRKDRDKGGHPNLQINPNVR